MNRSVNGAFSYPGPRGFPWLLLWTWILLSCRRQGQSLTFRLGLVDIFIKTQINMISPFDWQYRGYIVRISVCTSCGKFCLSLPGKESVCKILQFSVYTRPRVACVRHGFCFWRCLRRNWLRYSRSVFQRLKVLPNIKALLAVLIRDVFAILPTGDGKSFIIQRILEVG